MRPFLCKSTNSTKSGILLYFLIMVWYERTAFKRTYVNGLHVNIALRLDVSLQGFISAQNSLPQTHLSMIFVFYLLTNLPSVFIGYWSVLIVSNKEPACFSRKYKCFALSLPIKTNETYTALFIVHLLTVAHTSLIVRVMV